MGDVVNTLIGLVVGRMGDVVNTLISLVVGLLSGLWFERRATKAARAESAALVKELNVIRHWVLSVGGTIRDDSSPVSDDKLPELVRQRALLVQDSEGRVVRSSLVTHFVARGHTSDAIEQVIAELCAKGHAREVDRWLILS